MMPDLGHLLDHWGYLAVFLVVILGNVGLPVPEETILALAGYLVWRFVSRHGPRGLRRHDSSGFQGA